MYPINNASPLRVAVGAVVQISDGAVQTSGVSVSVTPQGGSPGAGGGTLSFGTGGTAYYLPTQAETNYTAFIIECYKTGCIPVSVTVVTTASGTAGRTMPADGSITAAVIATGAIDADAIAADAITSSKIATGAITSGNFAAGAITATAIADGTITAAKIASDAITDAKVASDVTIASVTGNVGGNVVGSVGSLGAQAKLDVNAEADTALADAGVTTTVTGRIDAAVSTRASQTSVDTVDDFLDLEVAAIKTKTDQLTFTVASKVDANTTHISGDSDAADNAESFFDGTGYGAVLQRTTIATLASQTSFTLTAGSADDNAYNDCTIVIQDASTAAQKAIGIVKDYTGASKTVTLLADPGVFTMATTDIVTILAPDFLTRYIAAICHGIVTGAGTGTEIFKGIDGTTRATVAVDASGNRSSVTYG